MMKRSSTSQAPIGLFVIAIAFLVNGCGSAPVSQNEFKTDPARDYSAEKARLEKSSIVCPGFTLRVSHSADESLSGEFKVNFQGDMKLPYKIKVRAAGLSTTQLEDKITKAYGGYFKVRNNVNVDIVQREFLIEIRGLVQKPGVYPVKLDTSIEEIIAMSGGLPGSAGSEAKTGAMKPEYIRIVRPDFQNPEAPPQVYWVRLTDYFLKYDVRNEVLWRGGEQLFFQVTGDPAAAQYAKSQTVQVLGEIHKPGEYPLQGDGDLFTYLTQAGGPTATADLTHVTVIHKAKDESDTFDISRSSRKVKLEAGDVILVKSTQERPGFFERMGPVLISLGGLAVSVVIILLTL